jgi:predicted metal-dependent hydrolase
MFKQSHNAGGVASMEGISNWGDGERILFLGREYNINVDLCDMSGALARFDEGKFNVCLSKKLKGKARQAALEKAFEELFRDKARAVLEERLALYSPLIGVTYNNMRVKGQKTRWGSCSSKGNLNFNWRLIMAPEWIIDYVIVHELCHLKHLNHSRQYWEMVFQYMPEYKKARLWLRENGMELYRGFIRNRKEEHYVLQ